MDRSVNVQKGALVGAVWVIILVAAIITGSFFPPLVKENFDLYNSYEYSQMYLEDEPYSDLVIEYDYVWEYGPTERGIGELEEKVDNYTEKEKIRTEVDDVIDPIDTTNPYDEEDLKDLMEDYKDHERKDNTISIHVLYLNGYWKESRRTLGLSKKPYNIVIFKEALISFTSGTQDLAPEDIEPSVLVHEFGHLLSLVGDGYESDHEDEENDYHCNEEGGECVMDASVEIKNNTEQGPPPTDLCELCKEDLEEIKNMDRPFSFVDLMTYGIIGVEAILGIGASIAIISKDKKREPPEYAY
ncbi:MAG: hypothetical protein KGY76_02215 [Candidatus Thermoplasmatota archaeon]|nr:hypothetical protein [Candidatus Thermoplasmatota archaeon]